MIMRHNSSIIMKFNWKQLAIEILRIIIAALSGFGGAQVL